MVTQIYKIRSEIWMAPSPKIWQPKDIKISAQFWTTSQLDHEYLRNATRYHQSGSGVANYEHSRKGTLNSMYFGLQMEKNRT